jgi:hypothetical protein
VTLRRGRRRNELQDDLEETRGYRNLKEESLNLTVWITNYRRGSGPVVRQTTERMGG